MEAPMNEADITKNSSADMFKAPTTQTATETPNISTQTDAAAKSKEAAAAYVVPVPELQGGEDVDRFAKSLVTALKNKDITRAQYEDARNRALHSPSLRGNTASSLFAQAEIGGGTEIMQTLYGGNTPENATQTQVPVPELQGGDDVAVFAKELTISLKNKDITLEQYKDARDRALRSPSLRGNTATSLFATAEQAAGSEIMQQLYGSTESPTAYVVPVPELQGGDDVVAFADSLVTSLRNNDITVEQYRAAKTKALSQPTLRGNTALVYFAQAEQKGGRETMQRLFGGN